MSSRHLSQGAPHVLGGFRPSGGAASTSVVADRFQRSRVIADLHSGSQASQLGVVCTRLGSVHREPKKAKDKVLVEPAPALLVFATPPCPSMDIYLSSEQVYN
jgi:hypothetical protein